MNTIEEKVSSYYTSKLKIFGNTAKGVDWNGEKSQTERFKELMKIVDVDEFSVLDYGCGYGALYNFLSHAHKNFKYTGFDISAEMIAAANIANKKGNNVFFTTDEKWLPPCDYVIASGIFNVKLDTPEQEWKDYIIGVLSKMNRLSSKGFSFNVLASYCDEEYKKDYLFYAEPGWLANYCKQTFSEKVTILQAYSLYEFTILVYK